MLEGPRGLFSITICGSMVFSYVLHVRIHCFLKDEEKRAISYSSDRQDFSFFFRLMMILS